MRWHVRLLLLCSIAVFAAGCSDSDRPTEPAQQTVTTPSFAEVPPGTACMGDLIWNDLNCNGVQDAGEPGLGGVTVKLYECPSNTLIDETVSEPNGYYALFGPAPDDYYIVVELPGENCRFSPKDVGTPSGERDIATDSDVDENGVGFCTNLHDQEIEKDMDAGICCDDEPCSGSVGDRIWFDLNCDGIQSKDEQGVPGVEVCLYTCEGELLDCVETDINGGYLFTGIPTGSYKVCFDLPEGYDFSPKDVGGNDGLDSDVGADGCTDCFIVDCGTDLSRDAGICEKKDHGGEGCTPGFWRNHFAHWAATPYSPGMDVNTVFGCTLAPAGTTLGEAIDAPQTYGVLVFHAIAGLLNASHPDVDYEWSVGEVIDAACDGDKDTIADANEAGCPLSGGNNNSPNAPGTTGGKVKAK
jgi:hypothetical protein